MYMSDLMVDANLFTENGSSYFKRTIQSKKALIETYSIRELRRELAELEFRQFQMNKILEDNGIFNTNNGIEFSESDRLTYESYRKDVSGLITRIKDRLLEVGQGIIKKSRRPVKNKKRRKTRKFRR